MRHLRTAGSMKAGIFSGDALAGTGDSHDELLNRVRNQPSMLGADLCGEVSTDHSYIVEPQGPESPNPPILSPEVTVWSDNPKLRPFTVRDAYPL